MRFLGLLFLLTGLIGNAYSFTLPELFTPQNVDKDLIIKEVLEPIFGYNVENLEDFHGLFMEISQKFTYGLLCIGIIIFAYVLYAGTLNTANTGKMLGQHWSSSWTVIRSVGSLALVFPVTMLSTIQLIVIWSFAQSIGFTNVLYEQYTSNPVMSNINVGDVFKQNVAEKIYQVTNAQLCVLALQNSEKEEGRFGMQSKTKDNTGKFFDTTLEDKLEEGVSNGKLANYKENLVTYQFGDLKQSLWGRSSIKADTCGEFTYSDPVSLKYEKSETFGNENTLDDYATREIVPMEQYTNAIFDVHREIVKNIFNSYAPNLANYIVRSYRQAQEANDNEAVERIPEKISIYLRQISNNYAKRIQEMGQNYNFYDKDVIKEMQRYGFASAGAWFFKINDIYDKVTTIANTTVNLEQKSRYNPLIDDGLSKTIRDSYPDANKDMAIYMDLLQRGYKRSTLENHIYTSTTGDVDDHSETSGMKTLVKWFAKANSDLLDGQRYSDTRVNIITQSHNVGTSMINGAIGVTVGYATFKGMQELADAGKEIPFFGWAIGGATSAPLKFLDTIFLIIGVPLLGLMIVPGFLLAYYIPFLPFIYWVAMLIGLMVNLVQTIIGVQFWMLAHLIPDKSDSLVGAQRSGYLAFMSLLFKAPLMIIGMMCAELFLLPIAIIINKFYFLAAGSVTENSLLGIIGMIAGAVIYFIITHSVVKKLYSLIYSTSDDVMIWFGHQGSHMMSSFARDIESGSNASATSSFALGAALNGSLNKLAGMGGAKNFGSKGPSLNGKNNAEMQLNASERKAELGEAKQNLQNNRSDLAKLKSEYSTQLSMKRDGKTMDEGYKGDDHLTSLQGQIGESERKVEAGEQDVVSKTRSLDAAVALMSSGSAKDALKTLKKNGGIIKSADGSFKRIDNDGSFEAELEKQATIVKQNTKAQSKKGKAE